MPLSLRISCVVLCLPLLSSLALAQQKFPYDALIIGDKVEVRSGPGARYYVTSLVNRNDPVKVRRHDHGGWYMIEPPRGSFSLIEAGQVKRLSGERGIVQPTSDPNATVKVRVGSTVSGEFAIYARELAQGDEVVILGEQVVQTETGPLQMLKIVPPSQEFRWIKGEYLAPVSQQIKEIASSDPYQIPVEHRQRLLDQGLLPAKFEMQSDAPVIVAEVKPPVEEKPAAKVVVNTTPLSVAYEQLANLDRRYRDMVSLPPEQWQLDGIEAEYRQLRDGGNATIVSMVEQRLPGVTQRKNFAAQARDIVHTMTAATERDAQLLAQQHTGVVAQSLPAPAVGMNIPAPSPYNTAPQVAQSVPGPIFNGTGGALAAPAAPDAVPALPRPHAETSPQKYSGAGIVTEVTGGVPGMPSFALIHPNGKFLTFLEPASPSVDLKSWIGKEAGMVGARKANANLGSDVITVEKAVAVSLTKSAQR